MRQAIWRDGTPRRGCLPPPGAGDSRPRLTRPRLARKPQTATRTANVRDSAPCRLAAGDLLSRSRDPCARSQVREILAETVRRGTADDGIALGRRPGVVR